MWGHLSSIIDKGMGGLSACLQSARAYEMEELRTGALHIHDRYATHSEGVRNFRAGV